MLPIEQMNATEAGCIGKTRFHLMCS